MIVGEGPPAEKGEALHKVLELVDLRNPDDLESVVASVCEVAGLEAEASRLRSSHTSAEEARARLRDAESFLDELARRVNECTREEKQAILRRAVPRVTVRPHDGGRKLVSAVYRFTPPVIIASAPPPESP